MKAMQNHDPMGKRAHAANPREAETQIRLDA
jgi:hypothetical protein